MGIRTDREATHAQPGHYEFLLIQESMLAIVHGSALFAAEHRVGLACRRRIARPSGFHRSLRPSSMAMLPMCGMVIVRWPVSAGA